ncbi:TolB family protein [Candidatus Zixiibacteriota bacterium]
MSENMNRREFLPLAGVGAIMAPTIITGCSSKTLSASDPISIPGTIAFERNTGLDRHVYIANWNAETRINLTADIPGKHGRPCWSPDGSALYFDSEVDGKSSIKRINDIADPVGSLETIVDDEGHQIHPQVHPDGDLLVYTQMTTLSIISNGCLVAYDMSSSQEISRTGNCITKAGDDSQSVDRAFVPGERNMIVTGVPGEGLYDPDTGVVEPYEFILNSDDISMNTVAFSSDGTFCYGLGMTNLGVDEFGIDFGDYDVLVRWEFQGERKVVILDENSQVDVKSRKMGELIELPEQLVMLCSCRVGLVDSEDLWRIGYCNLGDPGNIKPKKISIAAFDNMFGDNSWPRYTTVEHIL